VTLSGKPPGDLEEWNLRDAISGMPGVERLIDETMIAALPSLRSSDADAARPWFPVN
jgi:hypothetical protein